MSKMIDLTGRKFGKLVVIERGANGTDGRATWKCQCDCGNIVYVKGSRLRNGHTKSCGCLRKELPVMVSSVHGKRESRLYAIWSNMKQRCYNENNKRYKTYGARGITVCPEWLDEVNGFINFYNWSMANGYDESAERGECTLDRKDNDKGYSPENCRWTSNIRQQNNKSNTKYVEHNGTTHTISEWSKILGIKKQKLYNRIFKLNWSVEDAFTKP